MHSQHQHQRQHDTDADLDADLDADVQRALLLSLRDHVRETLLPRLLHSASSKSKLAVLLRVQRDSTTASVFADSDEATQLLLTLLQSESEDIEVKRQALKLLVRGCVRPDEVLGAAVRLLQENHEAAAKRWHHDASRHTFAALLLNFVRALLDERSVGLHREVAADLARILVRILAAPTTALTNILAVDLLGRVETESPESAETIQDAVAEALASNLHSGHRSYHVYDGAARREFDRERWQSVKLWDLGSALHQATEILQHGCVAEQYLVLKSLLASPRSVRERFVLLPGGVPAIADAVTTSEHNVASLAVDLARVVGKFSFACCDKLAQFLLRCDPTEYERARPLCNALYHFIEGRDYRVQSTEESEMMLALQNGADDDERARLLARIVDRRELLVFMSFECGLFGACLERLQDEEAAVASEPVRVQLWKVLCNAVVPLSGSSRLSLVDVRRFLKWALEALRTEPYSAVRLAIAQMLPSFQYQSGLRDIFDKLKGSRALISLLAQEEDAEVATALVETLRGCRASHSTRIDAQLWLVCDRKYRKEDFTLHDGPMLYQNLLAVCRDKIGLQLGAIGALDQVICASVAVELLPTANESEKTIIAKMLHSYMRADVPGVTSVLHDYIDDLLKLAMRGPVLCKLPARQMLRKLTRSGTACCEQIHAGRACTQPDPVFVLIKSLLRTYRAERDAADDAYEHAIGGDERHSSSRSETTVAAPSASAAKSTQTSFVSVTSPAEDTSSSRSSSSGLGGGGVRAGGGPSSHQSSHDDDDSDSEGEEVESQALEDERLEEEATRQRISSFALDDWEML